MYIILAYRVRLKKGAVIVNRIIIESTVLEEIFSKKTHHKNEYLHQLFINLYQKGINICQEKQ